MTAFARLLMLVALWLLAWGEVSLVHVISGIAVAAALLVAFPLGRRTGGRFRLRWRGLARLIVYVVEQLVISNVVMARYILRPPADLRPCVLAHSLEQPSDEVITVMSSIIALSPGTMTVDVTAGSSTIYVHFFHLVDVESGRRVLARLERFVTGALQLEPVDVAVPATTEEP